MSTLSRDSAECEVLPPLQGLSLPPCPTPARPCRRGHGVAQGQASGVWHSRRRSSRAEPTAHPRGAESPLPSAFGAGAVRPGTGSAAAVKPDRDRGPAGDQSCRAGPFSASPFASPAMPPFRLS